MLRSILAVVAGYAAMAVVVMAGFSVAFFAPTFAFQPGTVDVTPGWIVYTLILSLVAAFVGGLVCRRIARSPRPVLVFALIAAVVGLASAVQNLQKPPTTKSAEQLAAMPMVEMAKEAKQPNGYSFALPLLALAGILAGGLLTRPTPPQLVVDAART